MKTFKELKDGEQFRVVKNIAYTLDIQAAVTERRNVTRERVTDQTIFIKGTSYSCYTATKKMPLMIHMNTPVIPVGVESQQEINQVVASV